MADSPPTPYLTKPFARTWRGGSQEAEAKIAEGWNTRHQNGSTVRGIALEDGVQEQVVSIVLKRNGYTVRKSGGSGRPVQNPDSRYQREKQRLLEKSLGIS